MRILYINLYIQLISLSSLETFCMYTSTKTFSFFYLFGARIVLNICKTNLLLQVVFVSFQVKLYFVIVSMFQ